MEEDDDAQSHDENRGGISGLTEDSCSSTAVSCDGSGERRRMSWGRKARRGREGGSHTPVAGMI
jgi:hypothetical protein